MRHDFRDGISGQYREATGAEMRATKARHDTQTHDGLFTHDRDASERRMRMHVTVPFDVPRFKDKKVNRDAYRPKVSK